jgi:hypothetical protein
MFSLPWREGLREGDKMAISFLLTMNPFIYIKHRESPG